MLLIDEEIGLHVTEEQALRAIKLVLLFSGSGSYVPTDRVGTYLYIDSVMSKEINDLKLAIREQNDK